MRFKYVSLTLHEPCMMKSYGWKSIWFLRNVLATIDQNNVTICVCQMPQSIDPLQTTNVNPIGVGYIHCSVCLNVVWACNQRNSVSPAANNKCFGYSWGDSPMAIMTKIIDSKCLEYALSLFIYSVLHRKSTPTIAASKFDISLKRKWREWEDEIEPGSLNICVLKMTTTAVSSVFNGTDPTFGKYLTRASVQINIVRICPLISCSISIHVLSISSSISAKLRCLIPWAG